MYYIAKYQNRNMGDISEFCLTVANEIVTTLGVGHRESIYHNAFLVELRQSGHSYESERQIPINYKGHQVGVVRADLIINNELVLEFKAATKRLGDIERRQTEKYMAAGNIPNGLLINFWNTNGSAIEHVIIRNECK